MKKYFILLSALLFLSIRFPSLANDSMHMHHSEISIPEQNGHPSVGGLSGSIVDGVRVVQVKASRYKFEPSPIVVRLGEKVKIVLTSTDVTHGLNIPEFNVNIISKPGKPQSAEFIAGKKGTYHAHCSVYCGPGHSAMHVSFVVVE